MLPNSAIEAVPDHSSRAELASLLGSLSESFRRVSRVVEFDFTFVVAGQEGSLAWGYNFSSASASREPFAWAVASDGKTIVGADTDGSYRLSVVSADRMELCYTHPGTSPSKSIVATCEMMDRKK